MKPLLEGKQLFNLLPQKAPMTMVHALLTADEQSATTSFTVLPDNPFIENQALALPGLVENIAQTMAARSGFLFSTQVGQAEAPQNPPIGFIGAITKLNFVKNPPLGSTIQTTIKIEAEMMEVSLVSGESTLDGELLLSCSMKVFLRK
jgi:predicted hotdog family 3-hydroxylacyl-ACP dehydratase